MLGFVGNEQMCLSSNFREGRLSGNWSPRWQSFATFAFHLATIKKQTKPKPHHHLPTKKELFSERLWLLMAWGNWLLMGWKTCRQTCSEGLILWWSRIAVIWTSSSDMQKAKLQSIAPWVQRSKYQKLWEPVTRLLTWTSAFGMRFL